MIYITQNMFLKYDNLMDIRQAINFSDMKLTFFYGS
jgi:hypothetical protein